ncbi:MAG: (Fe-S)-binding protein [Syntrophobacteraceae bacterium]|jgi:Fe-S oxidoreductase
MYDPKEIIELIAANVRKTRNPFGVSNSAINTWWKDDPPRRQGDAMLFTGLMYQSVPYVEKTTSFLARYEDTPLAGYIRYGKMTPSFLVNLGFRFLVSREDKRKFNGILNSIRKILKKSDVDFFYRPELDYYSGILLHDLGDAGGFAKHAAFVAKTLKENGVTKLITLDPHTTYAIKCLYPEVTGESFEVRTYFEHANIRGKLGGGRVTLHDPCFYGRYLELSKVPYTILEDLGIECAPVKNSGKFTNCCGGPAESISPKLTSEILGRRIDELRATGAPVIAMCPICLGNLLRAGVQAEDFSTLVARFA